jgi:hypothetical protein
MIKAIADAQTYSFLLLSVPPTLSLSNALTDIDIATPFANEKSAPVALSSGWVAGKYLTLSHPGVGRPPTPDSLA